MKEKYIILLIVILAFSLGFVYTTNKVITAKHKTIRQFDRKIKKVQEKLNSARVLNNQLKNVSKVLINSITEIDEFSFEEINSFIEYLGLITDTDKIPISAISHRAIASESNLIQHQYTLAIDCDYSHTRYLVTIDLSIFKIVKEG